METRTWLKSAMRAVTCLVAFSLSVGCIGKYTGGGAIESAAGAPHRATFGCVVEGSVPDENGNASVVTGQFEYHDHGTGVRFHVTQLAPARAEPGGFLYFRVFPDAFNPVAAMPAYSGTYTCNEGTGLVHFGFGSRDQVEPIFGLRNQDALFVTVLTGPYAGYDNAGLVNAGRIRFRTR